MISSQVSLIYYSNLWGNILSTCRALNPRPQLPFVILLSSPDDAVLINPDLAVIGPGQLHQGDPSTVSAGPGLSS